MRAARAVFVLTAASIAVARATFDALMVTDVHIDFHYEAGSEVKDFCHSGSGAAGRYGEHDELCDTPPVTFKTILSAAAEAVVPPLVLYGGDSARHDHDPAVPRTEDELFDELKQAAIGLRSTFPDALIVPTIGNNDVYPHDILGPGPNAVLSRIHDAWQDILPANASEPFLSGGYFTVPVPGTRLVVISLNSLYFAKLDDAVHSCNHPSSPGAHQIKWLAGVMDRVAALDQRAILLGHVPPLEGKWHKACLAAYAGVMAKHADFAVAHLFGHTHGDALAALYSDGSVRSPDVSAESVASLRGAPRRADGAIPVAAVQTVPAVLPEFNPSFRVFRFNETSHALADYRQHYFDLARANEAGQARPALEYTATEAYTTLRAQGFGPYAFDALISQIGSDPSVAAVYRQYAKVMYPACT